jgi:Hint module
MHLVFVERNHRIFSIRAMDVVMGDVMSGKQVIGIQNNNIQTGVYSPLTQSGDIVVSGIVASNYVDVLHFDSSVSVHHTLGHMLLLPQSCFCSYFIGMCQKEGYWNGYGYYIYIIVSSSAMLRYGIMMIMQYALTVIMMKDCRTSEINPVEM